LIDSLVYDSDPDPNPFSYPNPRPSHYPYTTTLRAIRIFAKELCSASFLGGEHDNEIDLLNVAADC